MSRQRRLGSYNPRTIFWIAFIIIANMLNLVRDGELGKALIVAFIVLQIGGCLAPLIWMVGVPAENATQ